MSQEAEPSEYSIEQEAINLIRGRELLLDHYGSWPAFMDAEVIRLSLERAPLGTTATSDLRVVFYIFDIHRSREDPLRKQAHVEILFGGVRSLSICEWNHQNPIEGWSATLHRTDGSGRSSFHVGWGGIGHETAFDCETISILQLTDLNPFQYSLPDR